MESRCCMARRRSEQRMMDMLDDNMRSFEYLAWVCSELQTPGKILLDNMDALLQLTHDLERSPSTDRLKQHARGAYSMASQLHRIHSDMLIYSRLRSGDFPFRECSFNLQEKVEEVWQAFVVPAENRGIKLRLQLYGGTNYLLADVGRLQQVLMNLLDVMICYGVGPYIDFFVQSRGVDSEQNRVRFDFQIMDHGYSLRKEELELLCEPFDPKEECREMAAKYPMVGMKLFLARYFLSQMRGKLHIAASERQGTKLSAQLWMALDSENYPEQSVQLDPSLSSVKPVRKVPTSSLKKVRELLLRSRFDLELDEEDDGGAQRGRSGSGFRADPK